MLPSRQKFIYGRGNNLICFNDFNKELCGFLIQYIIMSKEEQKNHKFKDGELVFYYDSCFSNIHRLDLKEHRDLTEEVLYNTKCYNEGKEWDLLTGIYFFLPDNKKLKKIIDNSRVKTYKSP